MNNEVSQLLDALYDGSMKLDEVVEIFRQRSWPHREMVSGATYLEMATAEQEDPDPYIPESYDDVVAAYDRGRLTDAEYETLVNAIAASRRTEETENSNADN